MRVRTTSLTLAGLDGFNVFPKVFIPPFAVAFVATVDSPPGWNGEIGMGENKFVNLGVQGKSLDLGTKGKDQDGGTGIETLEEEGQGVAVRGV